MSAALEAATGQIYSRVTEPGEKTKEGLLIVLWVTSCLDFLRPAGAA